MIRESVLIDDLRRRNLRALLTRHRARIAPRDVGLREHSRPHRPGLRQDHVALLSGTSVRWYGALERGTLRDVDLDMLTDVATALRMDPQEKATLFCLAAGVIPPNISHASPSPTPDQHAFLEHAGANPAVLADHAWNVVAYNPAVIEWFGDPETVPPDERNALLWLFTDQAAECLVDIDAERMAAIARLQFAYVLTDGDPALHDIVKRLLDNPVAAELWHQPRAGLTSGLTVRRLRHPSYGVCTLSALVSELPNGLRLIMHLVQQGA